jgi:hypothetical protein
VVVAQGVDELADRVLDRVAGVGLGSARGGRALHEHREL